MKQKTARVTKKDIIMLVAGKLGKNNGTFTIEQLVVGCWEQNKPMFGLAGYEQLYPNNNKVLTEMMGESGLVRQNKLVRISTGVYRLGRASIG